MTKICKYSLKMKLRKEKNNRIKKERAKREYHYQYGFLTNFVNGYCHLQGVSKEMLSVYGMAS